VLQLDDIKPHASDGGGGDTMPDAPLRPCPSDGSAPTFTGMPRRIAAGCTTYTVGDVAWPSLGTRKLATAFCSNVVLAGLEGGPVTQTETGLTGMNPHQFDMDQMFMVSVDVVTRYQRDAATQDRWTNPSSENFMALTMNDTIGTPSATTPRHDIVFRAGSVPQFSQYAENMPHVWSSGGNWMPTGVTPLGPANLSRDGLRLVFPAYNGSNVDVYYVARTAFTMSFPTAPLLIFSGPSNSVTPFMTDDCQTLYFSDGKDVYAVDP
jgi:hypothetical protein